MGRFCGQTPKQAANKAFSQIIRKYNCDDVDQCDDVTFAVSECTRGSTKKTYHYNGKRVKLEQPVTYMVGDKKIQCNHSNVIKKVICDPANNNNALHESTEISLDNA